VKQAQIALILSCALIALVVILTLDQGPPRLIGQGARPEESLGSTSSSARVCQAGEILPAHVSAIRVGMEGSFGPRVVIQAYSGTRLLTEGERPANWAGSSVTVPVRSLTRGVPDVKLCMDIPANSERVRLWGAHTSPRKDALGGNGEALPGRIRVEYLGSSHRSWWSQALSVARHLGLGHPITGSWVALLLAALICIVSALMLGLAWRALP
jgi:hypothetical protein